MHVGKGGKASFREKNNPIQIEKHSSPKKEEYILVTECSSLVRNLLIECFLYYNQVLERSYSGKRISG